MSLRAVVALVALASAGVAHAQPTKEAGEHFERGEKAQAEGRYRDAIDSYEQAFRLVPHPNSLFNIAVCYERLGEWKTAADHYERYLDLDKSAADAAIVRGKIRALRSKAGDPGPPVEPRGNPNITGPGGLLGPGEPDGPGGPGGPGAGIGDRVVPGGEPAQRYHFGVSYGLGFGDSVAERWLAHGGLRIARRIDIDGVFGIFGKNDLAIGAIAKLAVVKSGYVTYLVRGAATIGYAKQDDSSTAGTRAPLGFEAGGAIAFGKGGRFELGGGFRWTVGGWSSDTTTADSYVNDAMAFVIDLGVALDFPVSISPNRLNGR